MEENNITLEKLDTIDSTEPIAAPIIEEETIEEKIDNSNPKQKKKFGAFAAGVGGLMKNTADKVAANAGAVAEHAKEAGGQAAVWIGENGAIAADKAKYAGDKLGQQMAQAKREADLKRLQPVFQDTLFAPEFIMPKMIRLVQPDKKHMENEVCEGSIGYLSNFKDMDMLNLYWDKAQNICDLLSLKLESTSDGFLFYSDPVKTNFYVDLDDYFDYYKKARMAELSTIASKLGAKYFKVRLLEKKKRIVSQNGKFKGNGLLGKNKVKANASLDSKFEEVASVRIEMEREFVGSSTPERPELVYFSKEPVIVALVNDRLNSTNLSKHWTDKWEYSTSSGIKKKQAAAIDNALHQMKIETEFSATNEAINESSMLFEYTLDF